ncbi:MAG: hypothetical protein KAY65_12020, partial [Planctomycetes bacterium]|nr:hypothetical protein [Planctomycetota bacterium]
HVLNNVGDWIDIADISYTGAWKSHSGDAWIDYGYYEADGDLPALSGNNKAYGYEDYIYQILDETFIEGETYTLSVWVGQAWEGYENGWRLYFTGEDYTNNLIEASGDAPVGSWQQVSLVYTATDADAGKKIGIKMWGEKYVTFEDVTLDVEYDPTAPSVDAGEDMITWSGEPVTLDPNVVNNDPCDPQAPLTYLWTADPADGVVFDSNSIEAPTVTITKPALTLTAVTIVNPGFEDPVLADGSWTSTPPAWTDGYYVVTAPTVWVVGDSDSGVYNPTAADGYGGVAPEGDNVMFATSGAGYDQGMNQVLSANLQANTQYDLSALVGNPFLFNGSTTTADYRIELLAGGVVLASDTGPSPADDTTWTTASLTYNSGDSGAQLGEALEIRLLAVDFTDGKGVDFDDVKLTAESPAPDPYAVKLTLTVNDGENPPVTDTMTIDVYDDACKAARLGMGLAANNPGDFDGNCITDFEDLAVMTTKWLNDTGLTEPIPKL